MWNHAIDHEVNALLHNDGFVVPKSAILYEEHIGESAETVFELIKNGEIEMRGECLDEHNNSPQKKMIISEATDQMGGELSKSGKMEILMQR